MLICGQILKRILHFRIQGRQSSEGDLDAAPPTLVWGTNISVQDVNQAVQRFLRNYRDSPSDLEGKYIQLLEQVLSLSIKLKC